MKTKRADAGIDVSKDELSIGLWPSGKQWTCPREEQAVRKLAAELQRLRVRLVVLEATGGLEMMVVLALVAAGVPVHRCEPSRARHFAKALGVHAKTDRVDALTLARFAASGELEAQSFAGEHVRKLDALVTRRRQLVDLKTVETNRLKASEDKQCRANIEQLLRVLVKQVKKLDAEIVKALEQAPELKAKADLLRTAPGIGKTNAATLVSALSELGTLNRWQVAALSGTAPYDFKSGKFKGQSRIFGGRAEVRTALYMAALTAVRDDPRFAQLYARYLAAGKKKKVALVACMRRLVVALNAMLRDQTPWRQTAPAA